MFHDKPLDVKRLLLLDEFLNPGSFHILYMHIAHVIAHILCFLFMFCFFVKQKIQKCHHSSIVWIEN